jgi:RNA polymerase sigma-70 factor (ECF subfamily)
LAGESEHWRALLARHGPALVLFARQWTSTHADAEDALQDALVRFLKAGQRPRDEVAYLYSCVRSAAVDLSRTSARRRKVDVTKGTEEPAFAPAPAQADLAASVEAALAQLPGEQREVLVMKIWGGLTFAQIGASLQISANTAASRYRYALQRLETALAHEVRND